VTPFDLYRIYRSIFAEEMGFTPLGGRAFLLFRIFPEEYLRE